MSRFRLWDRLFGIDLRTVAVFRIALGLYLLWDLVDRARGLTAHYTDLGAFPRAANVEYWSHGPVFARAWAYFSLHMLSGDAIWQVFLFLVAAGCAFALLVGYRSRLFAALSWVLVLSIQNRNPQVLHGGDQMIRHLLFWAMFLPLGARFSVDGLCAVCRAYQQPVPSRVLSLGSVATLLQVLVLYWFTAALKTAPEWRTEGSALYYALNIELYQTALGRLMLHLPLTVLQLMTWATMGLEVLGPVVAFLPWRTERVRPWVVAAFWFFHLGLIGCLMDVGPICETSALLWIPFLPGAFWEGLLAFWNRRAPQGLRASALGTYTALVSWRNKRIVQRIRKGEPLPEIHPTRIAEVVAAISFIYILLWNIRGLDPKRFSVLPSSVTWIANVTRMDQYWGMFAPKPMTEDGWFILVGQFADGQQVDLWREGAPVRWTKPESIAGEFPNERWRKCTMNLWPRDNGWVRPYYVNYFIRRWADEHPERARALKSVSLFYVLKEVPPPGKAPAPQKSVLIFNEVFEGIGINGPN